MNVHGEAKHIGTPSLPQEDVRLRLLKIFELFFLRLNCMLKPAGIDIFVRHAIGRVS
jgi:hypothetical protein